MFRHLCPKLRKRQIQAVLKLHHVAPNHEQKRIFFECFPRLLLVFKQKWRVWGAEGLDHFAVEVVEVIEVSWSLLFLGFLEVWNDSLDRLWKQCAFLDSFFLLLLCD